jgi:iron complex transport system substrate-binding protein
VLDDALGRRVEIPRAPARVIPIFASNAEIVAALGAGPRIVGIESFTRHPPDILDQPLIGGRLGFSVERIAALRPDLVVMTPARQAAASLIRPLDALGIPALVVDHSDLGSVFANIQMIGAALGEVERARELTSSLRGRLAAIRTAIGDLPRRRVYMETGATARGTFLSVRSGTYTADALAHAGGASIFDGLSRAAQVAGEGVIRADPEVILVAGTAAAAAELPRRPGWSGIAAVRAGAVHAVSRAHLLIPGPRVIDGVEQLARLLHPHAYPGRAS